jgi:hypothetical protein
MLLERFLAGCPDDPALVTRELATYALRQLAGFECPHDLLRHVRLAIHQDQCPAASHEATMRTQIKALQTEICRLSSFLTDKRR